MNSKTEKLKTTRVVAQIRALVEDSVIQKTLVYSRKLKGDWDQFFVALDTIEDATAAEEEFLNTTPDLFNKHPYLLTYGILNSFYLQQDAVNYLRIALFGQENGIKWKDSKYLELNRIRTIRNETTGHPTKTERKGNSSEYLNNEITFCTIDRSYLSREGFRYMLWSHAGSENKTITFNEIINTQDKFISAELNDILEKLNQQEMVHKSKFRGEKLSDLMQNNTFYQLHLIYGVQWKDHLAWTSFDYYHENYKLVKKGLDERYGEFGNRLSLSGTDEVVKKLDYIFSKLESFKDEKNINQYEFQVHVDALITSLKELSSHLSQIDEEFDMDIPSIK